MIKAFALGSCYAAVAGLDAIPIDQIPYSYMNTKHGDEIYWHMWAI